jgi:hypothetical protein
MYSIERSINKSQTTLVQNAELFNVEQVDEVHVPETNRLIAGIQQAIASFRFDGARD